MKQRTFPITSESILAAITAYLRGDGLESAAKVLDSSRAETVQIEYDNWNGGTYYYCLQINVSSADFIVLGPENVESLQNTIRDKVASLTKSYPNQIIDRISIIPTLTVTATDLLSEYQGGNGSLNVSKLYDLAKQIESYQFCSPSADPEKQTAVVYGFRALVKRFVAMGKRVPNRGFQTILSRLDVDIEDSIYEVYNLAGDAQAVIDYLYDLDISAENVTNVLTQQPFVDRTVIDQLRSLQSKKFDLAKLIRMCEEINSSYDSGNYISTALLIRALINHIPPIFGQATFAQVVSHSARSVKDLIAPLEENSRKIADLHTHMPIRSRESLPTRNQLEPYKANLEVLLGEIISRMHDSETGR